MCVPSTILEGRVALVCNWATSLSVIESLGFAVIEIEADGSVEHLGAHIQGAAEFVGGPGFLRQFRGNGFVGFVVAREEFQDCGVFAAILRTSGMGPR